jgi:hypothetical protein
MTRQFTFAVIAGICFLSVHFGFVRLSHAQWASNTNRDLGGVNHGDFIALQWDDEDAAAKYIVYHATSSAGPWTLLFSISHMGGGAKIHRTPDARLGPQCYKVEAADATGAVIKLYEPICVPQYAG